MAASIKWAWLQNKLINPEFAAPRGTRTVAGFAILAALLLHALLLVLVFQKTVMIQARPPMNVELVRIAPPPVVKPVVHPPPPVVKPVVKPVVHPPPPVVQIKPKPSVPRIVVKRMARPLPRYTPPRIHVAPANQDDGLGLGLPPPNAGAGQGSVDGFEASVQQRIVAAKTYPPGIKGMWNECVVNYRVTIDRGGQLLNYKLFGCGNPFIDAAARAAILLSAPFPVPPNFGGSSYDVFGSLVYKQQ